MELKNDVAVCMITNNSFFETVYCIERLRACTKVNFRFHIVDNSSTDMRVIEYCRKLCEETKGYFSPITTEMPITRLANILLQTVTQRFCVFMPINILVSNNWLEDLITSYNSCPQSGCISIRKGIEKLYFMPIIHENPKLTEDELINVHITENNLVNGLMMFDVSRLKEVGEFDQRLNAPGFEFLEFCFRFSANGYKNYYIMRNSCYQLNLKNEVLFPEKTEQALNEYKNQVEIMVKVNKFKK